MRTASVAGALLVVLCLLGCHSTGGPYGHAPRYVPLDDEARLAAAARDYDPVMVRHEPEEWRKGTLSLFGVVDNRQAGPAGQALLRLSVRRLATLNLCESRQDEDSCRVTVTDKDFGVVYALVSLRGDDDIGPGAVQARSLLHLVGTLGQDVSPTDGTPIVHASYYRHFPPLTYVTNASARDMKQ
jgi:hypothetical protein